MDSFDIANKKFKKLDGISVKFFKLVKEYGRDNIEELEESYEQEKKHREGKLMAFKEIETALEREEKKRVDLSKYSRNIIISFLACTIPFVVSFLLAIWFLEDSTLGKVLFFNRTDGSINRKLSFVLVFN